MSDVIDSNKTQLTVPDIIVRSLVSYGLKGMELTKAIAFTMQELQMEDCEHYPVRNTLFIVHYNPEKTSAWLKVLNIDTQVNLMANVESFLRYAQKQGTDFFAYVHEDKTPMPVFNHIVKQKLGTVDEGLEWVLEWPLNLVVPSLAEL